jgi:hypothetical protein
LAGTEPAKLHSRISELRGNPYQEVAAMICTLAFLGDCMAGIGLKEAAKLTGKNQSTIHRAMKNNKLAFTLDDSGQRLIDPAELDRCRP